MTLAPVRIDAPATAPMVGGLLAVANVHDVTDVHYGMGAEYYTYLCSMGGIAPGMCELPSGVTFDAVKQFTGGQVVTAPPFPVYAGIECDLFGAPYTTQSLAKLAGTEDWAVSRAFFQMLFQGDDPPAPEMQVCDNLDDLCDSIGALEQLAASTYAGLPVLHMNRRTAASALCCHALRVNLDGSLVTAQGTPVANAAGYPDGLVFITGAVHAWRTPVNTYDVNDTASNQALALAERIWSVGTECLTAWCGTVPVGGP